MKGIKELRILNYWAHMFESVVFGVDGDVEGGKSVDRNNNYSSTYFNARSAEYYIDTILSGKIYCDGNYEQLEQRYVEPRYPTRKERQNGFYQGQLYLSFYHPTKEINMILNFNPNENFESNIWFNIGEDHYRFPLKEYTSEIHNHCLGLIWQELEIA